MGELRPPKLHVGRSMAERSTGSWVGAPEWLNPFRCESGLSFLAGARRTPGRRYVAGSASIGPTAGSGYGTVRHAWVTATDQDLLEALLGAEAPYWAAARHLSVGWTRTTDLAPPRAKRAQSPFPISVGTVR
jgi:hypothetical protein